VNAQTDFAAGLGQAGVGGDGDGEIVAYAAGIHNCLVRMLFKKSAADESDHGGEESYWIISPDV